jgi:hypothetical protein
MAFLNESPVRCLLFNVPSSLDDNSLTGFDLGTVTFAVSELPELSVDDSSSLLNINGNEGKLPFTWCKDGLGGQGAAGQSNRDRHRRLVSGVVNDKLFEEDMVNDLYKGDKSVLLLNSLAV